MTDTLTTRRHSRTSLLLALLLVLLAVLPELPALHGEFQWDDEPHISQNVNLRDVIGLIRTWTVPGSNLQYYPLSITAFWLEYQCFGLEHLAGYHLVNMLLHAGNVLIVWLLLRRLRIPWAWLAAMLFAVHPLVVESVAYISELKNLLSGGCYLLAILAWLHWSDSPRAWGMWCLCLLAFVAAMLAKSTACTLPAIILLIEWWRSGTVTRRQWLASLPLFIIGAAMGAFFVHVEHHHVGAKGEAFDFTKVERLLIASHALWFYVGKLLWPSPLLVVYPRWPLGQSLGDYLYVVLIVAVVAVLALVRRRWGRGPLAGALIFAVLLFPALGFVNYYPMLFTFVANHYAYSAVVPFAVMSVGTLRWGVRRMTAGEGRAEAWCGLVLAAMLVPLTAMQAARWPTKVSLWEPAAAAQPDSWYVAANLANGYVEHDRYPEAEQWAERSLEKNPNNSRAWFTLARAWLGESQTPKAIEAYRQGLALEGNNAVALFNLAVALQQSGDNSGAEQAWRDVVMNDPQDAKAWNNLASVLLQRGAWQEGADAARRAWEVLPSYGAAHVNRGLALERLGRFKEAANELQTGLALIPENPRVRLELARSLAAADDLFTAAGEYEQVLRESPEQTAAKTEYEALLRRTGASTTPQLDVQKP